MEETLTRKEFFDAMSILSKKIDQLTNPKSEFITRTEIIQIHSRTWYENMAKKVKPIKQGGRTATVKFRREDYEYYLEGLTR